MKKGKKVICFIQAFDCEETVPRTMQSLIDQTYPNWLCYILSNGNTNPNGTPNSVFETIKNCAAKDNRFIVLNKKANNIAMTGIMLYHLGQEFPDDYICSLDADDIYKPHFFERAITFAEANNLDIVACGTDIMLKTEVGAKEEKLLRQRQIEHDMIIEKEQYTEQFRTYKSFFNEIWGKLYHGKLFYTNKKDKKTKKALVGNFAGDLLFAIKLLSKSERFGILSGTLHKYYIFEKRKPTNATFGANAAVVKNIKLPWFRAFQKRKFFSVYNTYNVLMYYLNENGSISDELYEYMQAVLFGWMREYYAKTLLYITTEKQFAYYVSNLIFNPKFEELMLYQAGKTYHNLKNYTARLQFCIQLKNMIIGEKSIQNTLVKKQYTSCSKRVIHQMDNVIHKLDNIISKIQQTEKIDFHSKEALI